MLRVLMSLALSLSSQAPPDTITRVRCEGRDCIAGRALDTLAVARAARRAMPASALLATITIRADTAWASTRDGLRARLVLREERWIAASPNDSTPAQRDTAAILAAARTWAKPYVTDSGTVYPQVAIRADTASVAVMLDRITGITVVVERRHGRWVAVRSTCCRIR